MNELYKIKLATVQLRVVIPRKFLRGCCLDRYCFVWFALINDTRSTHARNTTFKKMYFVHEHQNDFLFFKFKMN